MAPRADYFFQTSLPVLPVFGEPPTIYLRDLYERANDESSFGPAVAAVLLEHDLLARQSVMSGESEQAEPVVLTTEQVLGEAPLPEELQVESQPGRPASDDTVWERYYRYVQAIGQRENSQFLIDWAGFEVALRNALVVARAKLLELNAEDYLVATDLAQDDPEIAGVVARWLAAANPLSAQRTVDIGRWAWLESHGRSFSFSIDEAAAYARSVVLLERWERLGGQP